MIEVATQVERWELIEPFVTARDANTHVPVLVVQLAGAGGHRGWAEAAGVDVRRTRRRRVQLARTRASP